MADEGPGEGDEGGEADERDDSNDEVSGRGGTKAVRPRLKGEEACRCGDW